MHRLSECPIVATIDPTGDATGTTTTDVIDMRDLHEVVFYIMTETVAATGTVDFDVQEGTGTTAGTFNTTTAVASITQLTNGDDDSQVVVSIPGSALTDGYRYIRGVLTQGTANSECAVLAVGYRERYKDGVEHHPDLATVVEIVNA